MDETAIGITYGSNSIVTCREMCGVKMLRMLSLFYPLLFFRLIPIIGSPFAVLVQLAFTEIDTFMVHCIWQGKLVPGIFGLSTLATEAYGFTLVRSFVRPSHSISYFYIFLHKATS